MSRAQHTSPDPELDAAQATTMPTEVAKPAEEGALVALGDRFAIFNAGAPDRDPLSDSDLSSLDEIEQLSGDYQKLARDAWWFQHVPYEQHLKLRPGNEPPAVVTSLAARIQTYRMDCEDSQVKTLGSGRTKLVPYLSEEANRRQLAKDGVAIIDHVGLALEAGYARLADHAEAARLFTERIRFWLIQPAVRQLVVAYLAHRTASPEDGITSLRILLPLFEIQQSIMFDAERRGEALPAPLYANDHLDWAPLAQEILNEGR